MKKQLLLAAALFGMFFSVKAQEVTEDFNSYTIGNLGTDLTGGGQDGTAPAGQGGWYTLAQDGTGGTTFANENFQVVAGDAEQGNILNVTGPDGSTGSAFLWRNDMLDWEGRDAGNDAVSATFDFYTGAMDATAGNVFGATIYNDTYELQLNGFVYDPRTMSALGFAYVMLDGDTAPDNQIFNLPNLDGTAAATLPEDTWVTVTMTYDQATGQLTWTGTDSEGNTLFDVQGAGSAADATPFEFDLLAINGYANNAVASTTSFDNISVSLVGSTAGVKDNTITNLSVFPNPANNVVNVTADALVNNITVMDLNGRTVKAVKFNGVSEAQVNVSDLASGVYMMTIASDKGTTTKKIVKN